MATRDIIKQSTCFMVGYRYTVDVWKDPWVPELTSFRPSRCFKGMNDTSLMVDSLRSQVGLSWNVDLLIGIFDEKSAKAILDIHWARSYLEDKLFGLLLKKRNS